MSKSISFQNGLSIRLTAPSSSDQLVTLLIGGQEATLSLEETEKLYLWLHQHRETFLSFYGEGWELARTYWQAEDAPDTYSARLNLFNAHCHEINVSPYRAATRDHQHRRSTAFLPAWPLSLEAVTKCLPNAASWPLPSSMPKAIGMSQRPERISPSQSMERAARAMGTTPTWSAWICLGLAI